MLMNLPQTNIWQGWQILYNCLWYFSERFFSLFQPDAALMAFYSGGSDQPPPLRHLHQDEPTLHNGNIFFSIIHLYNCLDWINFSRILPCTTRECWSLWRARCTSLPPTSHAPGNIFGGRPAHSLRSWTHLSVDCQLHPLVIFHLLRVVVITECSVVEGHAVVCFWNHLRQNLKTWKKGSDGDL